MCECAHVCDSIYCDGTYIKFLKCQIIMHHIPATVSWRSGAAIDDGANLPAVMPVATSLICVLGLY